MYGYLRPMQGELKVRESERFKACYCGLCHTLGKKYGVAARFVLNYELVFLSMLLWGKDIPVQIKRKRCIAGPCRAKRCCTENETLSMCAAYSLMLAWWKLSDTIQDESFIKSFPHRLVKTLLTRAFRKAVREYPEFSSKLKKGLSELADCEKQTEVTLDFTADKFAKILEGLLPDSLSEQTQRPLSELLYHLGRWIYLIDAFDDYKSDVKHGRFNPLTVRFQTVSGNLADDDVSRLETTLRHSNNLLCSAFELLPENAWTEIIRNMIYLGMPDICSHVLDGSWHNYRRNTNRKWV